jgi:uncharacterized lipoprotein
MHLLVRFFILMCSLSLTSCSYLSSGKNAIGGRNQAYLSAKNMPPLRMPPDISFNTFHAAYPVSSQPASQAEKQPDLTPPGLENTK